MEKHIEAAEAVRRGHPDKVADQIADTIVDGYLTQDPESIVHLEALTSKNTVRISGTVDKLRDVDHSALVRDLLEEIGYVDESLGFSASSCTIEWDVRETPHDALGKHSLLPEQAIVYGYATKETEEYMPFTFSWAQSIAKIVSEPQRKHFPWLFPDGKVEVCASYDGEEPHHIDSIALRLHHDGNATRETIDASIPAYIKERLRNTLIDDKTHFYINPSGPFVHGGPAYRTGVSGRKILSDSYGNLALHGSGSFSGKSPAHIDRCGGYYARYIAKNIVASGICSRCQVQITYAAGKKKPLAIAINTFGTAPFEESEMQRVVRKVFPLEMPEIIKILGLKKPIYTQTAFGGHFGNPDYPWERTDKTQELIQCL